MRVKVEHPSLQFGKPLRDVPLPPGLPTIGELKDEFLGYAQVLLGQDQPPIDQGVMTLMEVADAYYARACQVEMFIYEGEREGSIVRGSDYYRFRNGALSSFLNLSKRACDLGSRRLTQLQLETQLQREMQKGI